MRKFKIFFYFISAISFFTPCTLLSDDKTNVTIAWETAPRTIDPRYAIDANSQYLSELLHCSLIGFNQTGTIIGDLAESWEWKTATILEVKLNQKAIFADGNKVTSDDVKKTYDFFKKTDLPRATPLAGTFKNIKEIKIIDKHQLSFELLESDSTFISNLMVGILPPAQNVNSMVSDSDKVLGCGPFILEQNSVSGMILKKNPKYSLKRAAKIENVIIKFVKEESTRFAKLRKGELDIVQNSLSRDKVKKIAINEKNLKIVKKPGLRTTYLGFNVEDQILKNVEIRRAIAMAINRDLIIKYILNDLAIPAITMLTPSDPFTNPNLNPYQYNVEEANQLLEKAGFPKKGEFRFELSYKTTQDTTRIGIAKAIAADLKKIGIKVKVQPLEWGRFKSDVDKGHVQLWSLSWIGFKDPDIYRYAFATESFAPNGGNRGKYSNIKLDHLMDEGRLTNDFEKRKQIYYQIQEIINSELPYVFLWHEENFAVMKKNIEGFEIYADGRYTSLINTTKL